MSHYSAWTRMADALDLDAEVAELRGMPKMAKKLAEASNEAARIAKQPPPPEVKRPAPPEYIVDVYCGQDPSL